LNIQPVQTSQTFQGRSRFLNKTQLSDAQTLLNKMNNETVYKETGEYTFSTKILGGLKIKEDGFFHDGRLLAAKSDTLDGKSKLKIGKTELEFDNLTGKITHHKKPFFRKWSDVMEKVSEYLGIAKENFDNKDIVEKRFIGINGFTKKGSDKVQEANKKILKDLEAKNAQKPEPEEEPFFLEPLNIY